MYEIELDGKNQKLEFSAAHIIPKHKKCGKIHGHNYFVDFRAKGNLNDEGQIMDFGSIKKNIRDICKKLDHKLILPSKNKYTKITNDKNSIKVKIDDKEYYFPKEDIEILPIANTTAEELSGYIAEKIKTKMDSNVKKLSVKVYEDSGQAATYQKEIW